MKKKQKEQQDGQGMGKGMGDARILKSAGIC
jgi:hypothetical protein